MGLKEICFILAVTYICFYVIDYTKKPDVLFKTVYEVLTLNGKIQIKDEIVRIDNVNVNNTLIELDESCSYFYEYIISKNPIQNDIFNKKSFYDDGIANAVPGYISWYKAYSPDNIAEAIIYDVETDDAENGYYCQLKVSKIE
ncbi:MAG: hypothetical protein GY941_23535 [Planctomycetes bacterium]|nr:hypothetical protein [Planctomycetota bacterium]